MGKYTDRDRDNVRLLQEHKVPRVVIAHVTGVAEGSVWSVGKHGPKAPPRKRKSQGSLDSRHTAKPAPTLGL